MAHASQGDRYRLTPPDERERYTGFQPVRPDNVPDVPPESLPRPSAESTIAGPQASPRNESSDGESGESGE